MSIASKFDGIPADYWDCRDSEVLHHETPAEALEDHVDTFLTPGCDVEKEIRDIGTIEVTPYTRAEVEASTVEQLTDHLFEMMDEYLSENTILANPDSLVPMLSTETRAKHRAALQETVRAICADADVWHCERGKPIEIDADEVIEIMRAERPDWFEPESQP